MRGQVFLSPKHFPFQLFRDCIPYTAYSLPLSPRHDHSFVLNSCCLSWKRRNNPARCIFIDFVFSTYMPLACPSDDAESTFTVIFRRHRSLLYHPADRCGISSLLHLPACRAFPVCGCPYEIRPYRRDMTAYSGLPLSKKLCLSRYCFRGGDLLQHITVYIGCNSVFPRCFPHRL